MRTSILPLLLSSAVLTLCACASTEPQKSPSAAPAPATTSVPPAQPAPPIAQPAEPAPSAAPAPVAPEPEGVWQTLRSNGGRYAVRVQVPEGGWQRGTPLGFDVRVSEANELTGRLADAVLVLDADMPEHLHGINRVPRIERRDDGTFRVENLYLHMPGWWELFFDVREGPWTERAQMRVDVE